MRTFGSCLALLAWATTAGIAAAAPSPAVRCSIAGPHTGATYAAFPAAIRNKIGPMAERDQPFQVTDVIIPGQSNPGRRVISAGHRGPNWFVWYEQGGVAYSWHVAVLHLDGNGGVQVLANAILAISWSSNRWNARTDVCALIDGAMAGRVPPYPPGASATTYF
jgi:hypothetical protein